jgi:hypothetical protein
MLRHGATVPAAASLKAALGLAASLKVPPRRSPPLFWIRIEREKEIEPRWGGCGGTSEVYIVRMRTCLTDRQPNKLLYRLYFSESPRIFERPMGLR